MSTTLKKPVLFHLPTSDKVWGIEAILVPISLLLSYCTHLQLPPITFTACWFKIAPGTLAMTNITVQAPDPILSRFGTAAWRGQRSLHLAAGHSLVPRRFFASLARETKLVTSLQDLLVYLLKRTTPRESRRAYMGPWPWSDYYPPTNLVCSTVDDGPGWCNLPGWLSINLMEYMAIVLELKLMTLR